MSQYAKFIVAALTAGLTAAQAIWVGNPYLTIAGAVLTALSVYFTPNAAKDPDAQQAGVSD